MIIMVIMENGGGCVIIRKNISLNEVSSKALCCMPLANSQKGFIKKYNRTDGENDFCSIYVTF